MHEMTSAYDWRGRTLIGSDGEKIGKVDELYLDQQTDKPEWVRVHTGLLGTKRSFVPLVGASPQGEDVRVTVSKDQVKDAPNVEPDAELSEREEIELFQHYGVDYTDQGSVTAIDHARSGASPRSEGRDVSGPTTDDAMTRSEEELRVGTARRERGRARLRKYVTTETQQVTMPLRREEVRLEREPITDQNIDDALYG